MCDSDVTAGYFLAHSYSLSLWIFWCGAINFLSQILDSGYNFFASRRELDIQHLSDRTELVRPHIVRNQFVSLRSFQRLHILTILSSYRAPSFCQLPMNHRSTFDLSGLLFTSHARPVFSLSMCNSICRSSYIRFNLPFQFAVWLFWVAGRHHLVFSSQAYVLEGVVSVFR